MERVCKKVIIAVAFIMMFMAFSVASVSADTIDSGDCGQNVSWVLTDDYTLTITGSGAISDYSYGYSTGASPWRTYMPFIKKVIIAEGITSIGAFSFANYDDTSLETVILPNDLRSVNEYAFYDCNRISTINIPSSIDSIGRYAFYGCIGMEGTTFPNTVTVGAYGADFQGGNRYAYNMALSLTNALYAYLNDYYLTHPEFATTVDFGTEQDKKILKALADYITRSCTTDTEKCEELYKWVRDNITYQNPTNYNYPIDVFRAGKGNCTGKAQLLTTLFKLSGIKAALIAGPAKSSYSTKTEVTIDDIIHYRNGHEFVMAFHDNDWYLFDATFGNTISEGNTLGTNDKERIADCYVPIRVDGITLSYEDDIEDLNQMGPFNGCYYINDSFSSTNAGSINQSGVRYKWTRFDSDTLRNYRPLGNNSFDGLEYGNVYRPGFYARDIYQLSIGARVFDVFKVKENGMESSDLFLTYNDNTFYSGNKVSDVLKSITTSKNNVLMIRVGETVRISDIPLTYYKRVNNTNVATVSEEGTITGVGEGSAIITFYYEDEGEMIGPNNIDINVVNDISSTRSFQLRCTHDDKFVVDRNITAATTTSSGMCEHSEYCRYCGQLIETNYAYQIPAIGAVGLDKTQIEYTGDVMHPTVIIKDSEGNDISSDYYDLEYSEGCIEAGSYQVTVSFKGHYSGEEVLDFEIVEQTDEKGPGRISSANALLQNDITMKLYATFTEEPSDVSMTVTMDGNSTEIEGNRQSDGRYVFKYEDISPENIGDEFHSVMSYEVDGKTYTDTLESYSVKQYCMRILNLDDDALSARIPSTATVDEARRLMVDTLLYGEETQLYIGHNIDNLAGNELTEEQRALATNYVTPTETEGAIATPVTGDKDDDCYWYSANAALDSSSRLKLYFMAPNGISNVAVMVDGSEYEIKTTNVEGKYYAEISDISADCFGDVITAIFKKNGEVTGQTLRYNINTYVSRIENHTTFGALAKRLYNYGKSSLDYVTAA